MLTFSSSTKQIIHFTIIYWTSGESTCEWIEFALCEVSWFRRAKRCRGQNVIHSVSITLLNELLRSSSHEIQFNCKLCIRWTRARAPTTHVYIIYIYLYILILLFILHSSEIIIIIYLLALSSRAQMMTIIIIFIIYNISRIRITYWRGTTIIIMI